MVLKSSTFTSNPDDGDADLYQFQQDDEIYTQQYLDDGGGGLYYGTTYYQEQFSAFQGNTLYLEPGKGYYVKFASDVWLKWSV